MMATSSKSTNGRVDKRGERLGLAGEKHEPSDRRTGEGEGGEKRGWSVMRLTRCSVDISKVVGGCEVEVVFTGSKTEAKVRDGGGGGLMEQRAVTKRKRRQWQYQ